MKVHLERVKPPSSKGKGGVSLGSVELDKNATVLDLKQAFAKMKKKYYVERQEWRLAPAAGQKRGEALRGDKTTLGSLGVKDGSVVYFKDLGTQIGYSTVFFWEYFGPMVIYPLFFLYPLVFYGKTTDHALSQKVACAYWVFHYAKRIFETYFVHKFSHATMPIRNLVKNCSYYWGFAALVSYFINHPLYVPPPEWTVSPVFVLAMCCQAANLYCHVALTRLRKPGETSYKIPRGFLFDQITCPNYTAEILGWFFFNVGTGSLMGYLFMLAGAYQMYVWAVGKHKRLLKMFDGKEGRAKYPRRYVIMPPFI